VKIEIIDNPEHQIIDFFDQKISEFNWQHWEVCERKHLAVQIKEQQGKVIAGAVGRTFGQWLLLKTLWVSEHCRGQNLGSTILQQIEDAAQQRGCKKCLLDTLNFQAMPFYKKHGYKIEWVQKDYPKTGCKYFMTKEF
jgi:ribosomal protein S18 acetylase RimI-like enzyme